MPYLELAENVPTFGGVDYYQSLAQNQVDELYINIPDPNNPGQIIKVREDYFDNLPNAVWEQVMSELADYQPQMMNGIFDRMRENIAARRERRDERRETRQDSKLQRIGSRSEGLFGGTLKNIAGGFVDMFTGGQQGAPAGRGFDPNVDFSFQTQQPTFFERNKALIIGGSAVGVGLIIWAVTRKKK